MVFEWVDTFVPFLSKGCRPVPALVVDGCLSELRPFSLRRRSAQLSGESSMQFSIKKPRAWFWQTKLTREEIEGLVTAGRITEDWLVCPFGEAKRSVEVSRFLTEPDVFATAVTTQEKGPATDSSAPSDAPPGIARRHDLDALRATAMLLGIVLHAQLAYVTFPFWPVRDAHTHEFFDLMNAALHGFRMPLFFVISGFFTAMLWRKRGLGELIKQRAKRILLPLAVLLIPIQVASIAMTAICTDGASIPAAELDASTTDGAICLAARENDVARISELLSDGADPDSRDKQNGIPALNWAALNGSLEAAELLLENGAEVDILNRSDRTTPLAHAVFTGRPELTALLIEHGANVNAISTWQTTPIHSADADEGMTSAVASGLNLDVDFASLAEDRAAAVEILKASGGKRVEQLTDDEQKPATSASKRSFTETYQNFLSWPLFHFPQLFGHMWFLWFLCLILAPFAWFALVADRSQWGGPPRWLFKSPYVLLWLVPLTVIPQWFNGLLYPGFGPDTSVTLIPMPQVIALYMVFFFVGAAYFDCSDAESQIGRYWWLSLPIALLLVFPIGMEAAHDPKSSFLAGVVSDDGIRLFAVFAQALYAWLMTFGMIGLFRKICTSENKIIRFVSDSSYWLYLAHIPLLFPIQAMLRPLEISAFIKMPLVFVITTGLLLLSYRYTVRYTWLGTMLNGKRTPPVVSEGPVNS